MAIFNVVTHRDPRDSTNLEAGKRDHGEGRTRKGDPTLLGHNEVVSFRTAERYLGISPRQRQKLVAKGTLAVLGLGANRKITADSLRRYLPPEEKAN
jgi:hypothetical protein